MSIFKGAGVAIVTPMKNNEEVNYDRLEQMIEYQINQGTDCIIIAGTTGESSTLTTEEHAEVIKAAVKFAKHRIPVVAGTGSNCTREAIHLSEEAEKAGVDGLLCVTPYYNKATPIAPIDINGTTIPSSPEYRSSFPSVKYMVFAACATFPVASLIATMFSTSWYSFAAVSGRILHPVRLGTLYMIIGSFTEFAISV